MNAAVYFPNINNVIICNIILNLSDRQIHTYMLTHKYSKGGAYSPLLLDIHRDIQVKRAGSEANNRNLTIYHSRLGEISLITISLRRP